MIVDALNGLTRLSGATITTRRLKRSNRARRAVDRYRRTVVRATMRSLQPRNSADLMR
jgi:hypothetical protein